MVTGYTATEWGDSFIASIQEPYERVVKILDWEILAGIRNTSTVGTLSLTEGSDQVVGIRTLFTNFSVGDQIIVGNQVFEIASIQSDLLMTFTTNADFSVQNAIYYLPTNSSNYFEYEYRWSDTGSIYTELRPLNKAGNYGDILTLTFNPDNKLYLDVRAEVAALTLGTSITFLSMEFTVQTDAGTVISCPQFCTECIDPFAYTGCGSVVIDCEPVFQPYNLTKNVNVYKELGDLVSKIFGHEVDYFRTEPDERTRDVILKEYSLHNVVDKQRLKIMVPDNEFPEENMTYNIFGMEFQEFEIHIVQSEFERAFGYGKKPRAKDYMFIPIINKMYEISSISLADEFNRAHSYWRVQLVKYQNHSSVDPGEYEESIDALVTDIEEVFGEEIKQELEQTSKSEQFQTVSQTYLDGIRRFVNRNIQIIDQEIKNRWTVISKNYYDLSQVASDRTAIEYMAESKLDTSESLAITLWFRPRWSVLDTDSYMLIGDTGAITGLKVYLDKDFLTVSSNGFEHQFEHGIDFNIENWYGLVLNINNKYLQMSANIYMLDPTNNRGTTPGNRPQDQSNELLLQYNSTIEMLQAFTWSNSTNYHLRGGPIQLTNIRIFEKPIEFEQHSNVLNQYVVYDNQLAILIDNAIPSLGYQKFKNAR